MARILFVNLEGRMGGAETSLALMAKSLADRFDIAVACPAPSPLADRLESHGIESHRLPSPPRFPYRSIFSSPYWARVARCLTRATRSFHPDIIHANSLCAGVASLLTVLLTQTPLVLHVRDLMHIELFSWLLRGFCQRVVAVSCAVEDRLVRNGVDSDRIQVVYNFVDDEIVRGIDNTPTPVNYDRTVRPVFANVGQFVPWKNQRLFLDAASLVVESMPQSQFVVVGDDVFGRDARYKQQLLDYAHRTPASHRITFTGWLKDMDRFWPRVHCLVHTAECEPFGRVLIEAMAHGIPVIAVNAYGPSEIVLDQETGILVPGNDAAALATAMLRVACDPPLAGRFGAAGRERVGSRFAAGAAVPLLYGIYENVLGE